MVLAGAAGRLAGWGLRGIVPVIARVCGGDLPCISSSPVQSAAGRFASGSRSSARRFSAAIAAEDFLPATGLPGWERPFAARASPSPPLNLPWRSVSICSSLGPRSFSLSRARGAPPGATAPSARTDAGPTPGRQDRSPSGHARVSRAAIVASSCQYPGNVFPVQSGSRIRTPGTTSPARARLIAMRWSS